MAQGMRPGGLTALAVVNFVFCFLGVIGAFGMVATMAMADHLVEVESEEGTSGDAGTETTAKKQESMAEAANRRQLEILQENRSKVYAQVGIGLLEALLFLLSGIGYLKQKRVMGRYLGSIGAVLGLASVAFQLTYFPFGLEHMSSIIYPVLVLILLNTTFRDDLVH